MVVKRAFDSVHRFINDLGLRIAAQTGIPSDRYHLGKLILQSMKDAPDFIMQIDGVTDESETNRSAIERTIKCAINLKNMGLEKGDVIVLSGNNTLDVAIPFYAALYLGVAVSCIDASLGVYELKDLLKVNEPKLVFCQAERTSVMKKALTIANIDAGIITFEDSNEFCSLSVILNKHVEESEICNFMPTDIDPDQTIAVLATTSGTTGVPKAAALSHKNLSSSLPYLWVNFSNFPTPTKIGMVVSHLQWLSAGFLFLFSPIIRVTRLQGSKSMTQAVFCDIVNKYKPTYVAISPTLLVSVMKPTEGVVCDLSSFEAILMGGSAAPPEIVASVKKAAPNATLVAPCYGLSEIGGLGFMPTVEKVGSSGKPVGCFDYKLVDIETQEEINEANVQGELWLRGPPVCKGYYKNPEATADAFVEDGWFRTGDLFYRDSDWDFYFVDRHKLLMKYKSHQISPIEVEAVIIKNPGVQDVAVTSIPDLECGDLAVACVIRKPGYTVTAQEIKDLVKEKLADSKQLRGGVIFMNELPTTITTKVHRRKLKEMVLTMERE